MLRLTHALYVLCGGHDPTTGDDVMLPEGTPGRDPKRVGESELLGAEWQFEASLDDGRTWRAFATMLNLELQFPGFGGGPRRVDRAAAVRSDGSLRGRS